MGQGGILRPVASAKPGSNRSTCLQTTTETGMGLTMTRCTPPQPLGDPLPCSQGAAAAAEPGAPWHLGQVQVCTDQVLSSSGAGHQAWQRASLRPHGRLCVSESHVRATLRGAGVWWARCGLSFRRRGPARCGRAWNQVPAAACAALHCAVLHTVPRRGTRGTASRAQQHMLSQKHWLGVACACW